jgi:hypothetical protein
VLQNREKWDKPAPPPPQELVTNEGGEEGAIKSGFRNTIVLRISKEKWVEKCNCASNIQINKTKLLFQVRNRLQAHSAAAVPKMEGGGGKHLIDLKASRFRTVKSGLRNTTVLRISK